jgi:hypothetical protein
MEDQEPLDASPRKTTPGANPSPPLAVSMKPCNTAKSRSRKEVDDDDSHEEDQPKKKPRHATSNLTSGRPSMDGQTKADSSEGSSKHCVNAGVEPSQHGPAENLSGLDVIKANDGGENLEDDNVSQASWTSTDEVWEELSAEILRQSDELTKKTGITTQDILDLTVFITPRDNKYNLYVDDEDIIERQQPNEGPVTVRSAGIDRLSSPGCTEN